MSDTTSRDEVRAAMRDALLYWRAEGVVDPVIPMYADVDGDGKPDFYGLDPFGQVTIRNDGTGTDVSVLDRLEGGEGP